MPMGATDATPAELADLAGRRVVVSGAGAVSGFGWGVEPLWQGLRAGATSIRPFSRFDHAGHRTHVAAEVPPRPDGLPAAGSAGRRRGRRLSLADTFALAAAGEALQAAGLGADLRRLPDLPEGAAGVFFGSSTGGMWESEGFLAELLAGRRGSLRAIASQQVSGPGEAVARGSGVTGPVETVSSACASGALAIAAALSALRGGEVELALAGGSDSLCQLTYAGFNSLRAVDEAPCRPFRAGRAGMSIGEGAAVLVLEPLARVLARGATPLAELAGAGSACDAFHMTAPEPRGAGAAAAIVAALADAGLEPADVDFVNAHATGTPLNDEAEWRALEQVFGERARRLPVTATKAAVGHLLGCSGAIEALATVLSLARGELHPVPDPAPAPAPAPADSAIDAACPAALVVGRPLALPGARVALSTSLAFGGSNAALVFKRWTGAAPLAT
ncbi:MAG: beta-ketoacyl-[acyl-carrier-protein] synthase family protein [Acidobacteria bacterium]|nr:beta-ketoacyl-[acyl-carrier-protein] synthase family protein [Acidobacteriota bacterium]